MTARLLLDPGDAVLMEDPGYPGAVHAFRAAGARIIPIAVDAEGLSIDLARHEQQKGKLVYTTPANQFPLGITTSLARRLELLNWAITQGAWIVEDEFDAEYRYFGRPVPAIPQAILAEFILEGPFRTTSAGCGKSMRSVPLY